MSTQKWIKRGTPKGNVICEYTSSRTHKKTTEQDAKLAQLGLTFAGTHTIKTLQFGDDQVRAVREKIAKSVNFSALKKTMMDAGTPENIADKRVAAMLFSINLNANINEIVRDNAVATHKLGSEFWGSEDTEETVEIKETAAVGI